MDFRRKFSFYSTLLHNSAGSVFQNEMYIKSCVMAKENSLDFNESRLFFVVEAMGVELINDLPTHENGIFYLHSGVVFL